MSNLKFGTQEQKPHLIINYTSCITLYMASVWNDPAVHIVTAMKVYLAHLGGLLWKIVNFWQFKGWLSSLKLSISLYSTTFPSCWPNLKVSWLLNISTMTRREKQKWWYCNQSNCLLCETTDHYVHLGAPTWEISF